LNISEETKADLSENLLLFFTGFNRDAGKILEDQNYKSLNSDEKMFQNLHKIKELGFEAKKMLENGKTKDFGKLLHEHWLYKKSRSDQISNPLIDEWYQAGINSGAIGGKLVGAGGGGFLMFYVIDKDKIRNTMKKIGLKESYFVFDFEGSKIL
jgi:D-glycero-alpha-D-manno-heptose-7-phosphate kinase